MGDLTEADVKRFEVCYVNGFSADDTVLHSVKACYWQRETHDEEFIHFKNVQHKPVFSVRADRVMSITEVETAGCDSKPGAQGADVL